MVMFATTSFKSVSLGDLVALQLKLIKMRYAVVQVCEFLSSIAGSRSSQYLHMARLEGTYICNSAS